MCGSCHTVHLPVLHRGKTIGHTYEQTTYPEWAFSDYRTGTTPDGPLPLGRGARAQSCQDCHMPNKSADGTPYRSKIASIQEYSNFPQTEQTLPPAEIDLPVRSGVSKHTLVGLNIFLVKMARQFADILGLRPGDPMLGDIGIDPTAHAEAAILEQAEHKTATIAVDEVKIEDATLSARVTVTNKAGHKFPSGVAFPPGVHRIPGARRGQQRDVVLRPDQRPGGHCRRQRRADPGRAVVDAGLRAHQSGRANSPAALPGHHPRGPGSDLRGTARVASQRSQRRSAGPA